MQKKQISITSFKGGLDTRREELVSTLGVLKTAQDGVFTAGGDFEKRKGFFLYANVGVLDTLGDVGTFGIQDTINGLYVFGSALANGSSVTLGQPTLVSVMPTGVTYQQLKHPALYDEENYDRTKHRMVSALVSEPFTGLPQVAATFADGKQYMYYNGALVEDCVAGLRMIHLDTNAKLAKNLARVVNALGNQFDAVHTGVNEYVDISGPTGLEFSSLVDTVLQAGSTGTLSSSTLTEAVDPIPGVTAKGQFRIIAGEDSPAASSTLTNDGTAPANGSTVVIDGVTYTWKTAISGNHDVLIGASNDTAMQNLIYAINFTGNPGTEYVGTEPHPTVKVLNAYDSGANTFQIVARALGTAGNTITTTVGGASHCSWTGATLASGLNTHAITSVKVGTFDIIDVASPIVYETSPSYTAAKVATAINAYASNYTATSTGDTIIVTAASEGASQNGTDIVVTTQGQVCIGSLSAAFVLGGTGFTFGVFNIDGIDVSGTLAGKVVGSAASDYTSLETFCQALADEILVGAVYTAVARGNIVYVSKIVTSSSDVPLNVFVTITPRVAGNGSGVTVSNVNTTGAFLVDITPTLNVVKSGTPGPGTGGWVISTQYVTAVPYFGKGPYTYDWQKIDGSEFVNFWLQFTSFTFFYLNVGLIFTKGTYVSRFKCVVTDSLGEQQESGKITVTINYI